MSRRYDTVEVPDGLKAFDFLIDARQRVRTLVVEADPEQASWSTGHPPPRRPETPNRLLALSLMGVHDLLDAGIGQYIDEWHAREDASFYGALASDPVANGTGLIVQLGEGENERVDALVGHKLTLIDEGPRKERDK